MRANKTYKFTVHFMSKNPETALNSAKRLLNVNYQNKNFRYKYNKVLKEIRERSAEHNVTINPMSPIIYDVFPITVEGEQSKKMYGVQEDGVYYCVPVLHFVEDSFTNGRYLNYLNSRVEVSENVREMSDDEFLEYVKNNII